VHVASLCLLLALSAVLAPPSHATAIATGSIQVTNFTVTPASGTVVFGGPWTAQAFAQAQNSLGENVAQFNSSTSGTATADALVTFAQGHSSADAVNVISMGSAGVDITGGVTVSSAVSQETISNTFQISGGGGPVNVTFGVLLNSMQNLFTDSSGVFASSEATFTLSVDGQIVLFNDIANQIGPSSSWTNNFSGDLTNIVSLNENQVYQITLFADPEDGGGTIPEPSSIALALGGAAVGFIRRVILAKHN
jgi:hypothetical protein